MKNTNLLKSVLILFFAFCTLPQSWGTEEKIVDLSASTSTSNALYTIANGNTWGSGNKQITLALTGTKGTKNGTFTCFNASKCYYPSFGSSCQMTFSLPTSGNYYITKVVVNYINNATTDASNSVGYEFQNSSGVAFTGANDKGSLTAQKSDGCSNVELTPTATSVKKFKIGRGVNSISGSEGRLAHIEIWVEEAEPATSWFVKGGWNSWGVTDNLRGSGTELTATVNIATAGLYEFKIFDSTSSGTWYGNNGKIGCNISGWTFSTSDDNCKFFASETGKYTFTFNTSTKALSITYPTAQNKFYYQNSLNWGSVYVYRFVGGINNGWSGEELGTTETICGTTYYYTYADPGTTIIFNINSDAQTGDMSAAAGNAGKYVAGTGNTWQALPTFTVSYNANGGSGSMSSHTGLTCGATQTVSTNTFTRTGWTFTGWNTSKYGTGTAYANGASLTVDGNVTLYAQWEKTVYMQAIGDIASWWYDNDAWFAVYCFDSEADSYKWVKMSLVDCETDVYKATIPGNGFNKLIFCSMNKDKDDLDWASKDDQSIDVAYPTDNALYTISSQNLTGGSSDYGKVYGSWGAYAVPTFTISYAKGSTTYTGGNTISGSKDNQSKTCGTAFTLPSAVFTTTGYTQTGWATSDGGSKAYNLGGSYTTDAAQTFYPVWTINSHTLTWDLNGGTVTVAGTGAAVNATGSPSTSVNYGADITTPTVTRTGYTFSSWNTTPATTMPDANTTYTAQWTVNKYSVTHTLSNVTATSGATGSNAATYGTDYTATFSRTLGYNLPASVTVTAGGSNITANCTWNSSTGKLTIPGAHIVGNIVITVSGTAVVCPERGESPTTLYSAVVAATSAQSIPAGASNQRLTPSQATVTGGFMSVYNGQAEAKNLINKQNNKYWFSHTNNDTYFRIDLDCALQKGDIITADCYATSGNARGIWISSAASRPGSAPVCAGTRESEGEVINYKVTTSDEYYGKQTLYIYRGTTNTIYFNNIKITRPAACIDPAAVTSFTCSAQTQTSLTYTWTKATGATGYTAQLWDNSSCTGAAIDTKNLGNVATVTFTGLDAGNTYYCKITSLGDGEEYCDEGATTNAASGTTSACTAISPTFSYPFMKVAKGITIIPDIDTKGSSGAVSYASSATGVITNDRYVTATSGTATLTATVAAKGAYCQGTVTSGTFTAVSDQTGLIHQALSHGSSNSWGTPAAPSRSDATNITSTTAISKTSITIDSGKGNDNNDGQTAKVGSLSAYDASKYMSLGFTVRTGKKVNVNAIYIPVQPVTSNTNTFKAVLSDASTSITGTISNVPNGKLTYIKFDSYGTIRGNATLKIYAYGWTNGYRFGKGIVIDGTVVSETYTVTLNNQGATTAGAASIDVDFETVTGNISSQLPAKAGYSFGGYYTETDGGGVQLIGSDGTFNSSVTGYTNASRQWIATSGVTLYAKWTPAALTFTGASNSNWSNTANWTPACVPTIEHDVVIAKPVEVEINHATAKSVVIYNDGSTHTGKLTIQANKGVEVAGTISLTTNGTNSLPTRTTDLILESSSAGNATLIFDNSNEDKATVYMYSKGWTDEVIGDGGEWNWQMIGSPVTDATRLNDYYDGYMYKWNGGWVDMTNFEEALTPFAGYSATYPTDAEHLHTYEIDGTLVATGDKSITIPANTSVMAVANSWTAPIYVKNITFTDSEPENIYIYNTGYNPKEGSAAIKGGDRFAAGTYHTVPINSSPYTGDSLIASMQGFFVRNKLSSAGSMVINYDDVVRPSGNRNINAGQMHAPKREAAAEPVVMKLYVSDSEHDDRVVLLERSDFSRGFDNGWDGEKFQVNAVKTAPRLFAINETGGKEEISAIPEIEGTVIGFRPGTEMNYTISFEYSGAQTFYLYDTSTGFTTLIDSESEYAFTSNGANEDARFVIARAPAIATGVEDYSQTSKVGSRKLLIDGLLYIERAGQVYTIEGTPVK